MTTASAVGAGVGGGAGSATAQAAQASQAAHGEAWSMVEAAKLATIVATIGPASDSPEMVRKLIESGVGVFRLNFSHGTLDAHAKRLQTIRSVSAAMRRTVAVLGDLQGPKIRVGKVPAGVGEASRSGGGSIALEAGQDVVLSATATEAFMREGAGGVKEAVLPLTYAPLVDEVEPGHRILINDGAIRMLAVERVGGAGGAKELRCRVTVGGLVTSGKGINLPESDISAPALSEHDLSCMRWGVENDLDYLALSFVRKAEEVEDLRRRIAALPCPCTPGESAWVPIISKIEKPQAVANLESIVAASDGVMVARGDLGVEMDIARVPTVQKRIVEVCGEYGKPCIVATQMLETMIESPIPTRAEASDVANAIFDGADAVMLSAETATGKHPALVVETMSRIIAAAEAYVRGSPQSTSAPTRMVSAHRGTAALAHGAWVVARDIDARAVVVWSQNGGTARYLSQNRLNMPILAYSSSARAARRMSLYRGVTPICSQPPGNGTLADWNAAVDVELQVRGLAKAGDAIVLLAGRPLGQAKATNTIAIHRVGETAGGYRAHKG
jgi:pyruvate kinase